MLAASLPVRGTNSWATPDPDRPDRHIYPSGMPNFTSSLVALPPATRALTAGLVALSTLFFFLRLSLAPRDLKSILGATGDNSLAFPWLVLVPGSVLWYPWTLITAAFVETNFIEVGPVPLLLLRRVSEFQAGQDGEGTRSVADPLPRSFVLSCRHQPRVRDDADSPSPHPVPRLSLLACTSRTIP